MNAHNRIASLRVDGREGMLSLTKSNSWHAGHRVINVVTGVGPKPGKKIGFWFRSIFPKHSPQNCIDEPEGGLQQGRRTLLAVDASS